MLYGRLFGVREHPTPCCAASGLFLFANAYSHYVVLLKCCRFVSAVNFWTIVGYFCVLWGVVAQLVLNMADVDDPSTMDIMSLAGTHKRF